MSARSLGIKSAREQRCEHGACFGNAKSRFCSDISYLFIWEKGKELRGRGNNKKEEESNFHILLIKDKLNTLKSNNNLCSRKHVMLTGNRTKPGGVKQSLLQIQPKHHVGSRTLVPVTQLFIKHTLLQLGSSVTQYPLTFLTQVTTKAADTVIMSRSLALELFIFAATLPDHFTVKPRQCKQGKLTAR